MSKQGFSYLGVQGLNRTSVSSEGQGLNRTSVSLGVQGINRG